MWNADHQKIILDQCANQGVTDPERIDAFRRAYVIAFYRSFQFGNHGNLAVRAMTWKGWLLDYADLIEPCNMNDFRKVPVTFANGNRGLAPELIDRALTNLCNAIADNCVTPEEAYLEFEKIHPFEDGNGRVGHLLWATLMCWRDGEWPMRLPPNLFEEKFNSYVYDSGKVV